VLVGGFIVVDGDEVLAIKQSGQVTRSAIDESLRATSRDTKGVKFVGVREGDAVAVVARSIESTLEQALGEADESDSPEDGPVASTGDDSPVEVGGSTEITDDADGTADADVDAETEES
jgi:DNA gyrase subunit A